VGQQELATLIREENVIGEALADLVTMKEGLEVLEVARTHRTQFVMLFKEENVNVVICAGSVMKLISGVAKREAILLHFPRIEDVLQGHAMLFKEENVTEVIRADSLMR
jgi:hypothetical protein